MLKEKNKILYLIGIILILMSVTIHIYYEIKENQTVIIEEEKIGDFLIDTSSNSEDIVEENIVPEQSDIEKDIINEDYLMLLKIKDINLNKGLYSINSKYNNVDYGIEILTNSILPNNEKSVIALASHSGTSSVAFFDDLNKLEIGAVASLFFNGIEYKYKLDNTQTVEKTGTVEVDIESTKKSLILITCKRNSNEQLVFVFYLDEETKY